MNIYRYHSNPKTLHKYKQRYLIGDVLGDEISKGTTHFSKEQLKLIASNPRSAYLYWAKALNPHPTFDRKRWPAGEKAIASSRAYLSDYIHRSIKGKWPEGEHEILKYPNIIIQYAVYRLRKRWPEGEKVLHQAGNENALQEYEQKLAQLQK